MANSQSQVATDLKSRTTSIMKVLEHDHLLNFVDLQPTNIKEDSDDESDEDNDLITNQDFRCLCDRCGQLITWFHRYYYKCANTCNYSLHKFCVNLPTTLKNTIHHAHTLALGLSSFGWNCNICRKHHRRSEIRYRCEECDFDVDVNCYVDLEEKKIYHPIHPHPIVPTYKPILSECGACGKEHKGIFYHCLTCSGLFIHTDCLFLPKKVLIQQTTNAIFSHIHPLIISYSFPLADRKSNYYPKCRICDFSFKFEKLWIYKCEKCRYFAHVDCATSRREPFMSIFLHPGLGKTIKNFKDVDHPDLLHLPFIDQSDNILKRLFSKESRSGYFETDAEHMNHIVHQHPLSLVHTQHNDTTRLSCHDPMKKIELLCNGCIRPITSTPFYKCSNEDEGCDFVLHEWCAMLPVEVKNHPGHKEHALVLLPNKPRQFSRLFCCDSCSLLCNGFAYGCVQCNYYVDVNCGFIPDKVTHEAHPNHLFLRGHDTKYANTCRACKMYINGFFFSCVTCDYKLHLRCAMFLPRSIRHKYDKHPMDVSYFPVENHKNEYFCEVCEQEFNPHKWFYHCKECVQSMHAACTPLILDCESANSFWRTSPVDVYICPFLNIKFGSIRHFRSHPHPLSLVKGVKSSVKCALCPFKIFWQHVAFKCVECKFACHVGCAGWDSDSEEDLEDNI